MLAAVSQRGDNKGEKTGNLVGNYTILPGDIAAHKSMAEDIPIGKASFQLVADKPFYVLAEKHNIVKILTPEIGRRYVHWLDSELPASAAGRDIELDAPEGWTPPTYYLVQDQVRIQGDTVSALFIVGNTYPIKFWLAGAMGMQYDDIEYEGETRAFWYKTVDDELVDPNHGLAAQLRELGVTVEQM